MELDEVEKDYRIAGRVKARVEKGGCSRPELKRWINNRNRGQICK